MRVTGCTVLTASGVRGSADEFRRWPEEQYECSDTREQRRGAEGSGSPARFIKTRMTGTNAGPILMLLALSNRNAGLQRANARIAATETAHQ